MYFKVEVFCTLWLVLSGQVQSWTDAGCELFSQYISQYSFFKHTNIFDNSPLTFFAGHFTVIN